MRPLYQKLTAVEFNRAVKHLKKQNSRISDKNLDLARQVLVEDIAAPALAQLHSCTIQLVNRQATRLHQAFKDSLDLPPGWVSVRVDLPADEADKVTKLEAQLKATLLDRRNLPT